jgi:hypothetical protein
MKAFLFAAALTVASTVTVASAAQRPSGETVPHPDLSTGPPGKTQQGTDPEGKACIPPGYNKGNSIYPPCEPRPAPLPTPPACTRDLTDGCLQEYERGRPH